MAHICHEINPRIPVTLRYRYAVCRGVTKSNTVPVPVVPVSEAPRVNPYPCKTLPSMFKVYRSIQITCGWQLNHLNCSLSCLVVSTLYTLALQDLK